MNLPQTGEIAEVTTPPQISAPTVPNETFSTLPNSYGYPMYSPYAFPRFGYPNGSFNFLDKISQYVYSLCDIAHMLEMNAPGLIHFLSILKATILKITEYGKSNVIIAFTMAINRFVIIRNKIAETLVKYLFETNLPANELENQIRVIRKIRQILFIVFVIILFRYLIGFL